MAEDSIVRQFNSADIEQRVADGYINLNQMAKATGKPDRMEPNRQRNTMRRPTSTPSSPNMCPAP